MNYRRPIAIAAILLCGNPGCTLHTSGDSSGNQLTSHAWRLTKAPTTPANGSLFIFLADGKMLQTSCVETYRIATWSESEPKVLSVVENGQLAFTARITELTSNTLRLDQRLVRSNEQRQLEFAAVARESVCPDLR
jgi:hypothetical protein